MYLLTFFLAAACASTAVPIDLASIENKDLWMRHPVWGDPSFDSFERMPGNPVHTGKPPYAWPVNGFLFQDPPSGHWYLYVGHYLEGYQLNDSTPSQCTVFRSRDQGLTWEELGPVLSAGTHIFEGETSPLFHAPDVSVVYDNGMYHLCFDWTTRNTTWGNAASPGKDSNSGVGYAFASRPEGPFQPTRRPLATTREQQPLLGKYKRLYASSLIKRDQDWLVLTLTDSGPHFGWAMLGMTASAPEGPYTTPHLLLHPESDRYHPPLLEFFPAYVHDGHVYMPATSVAMNRNFMCTFRAPLEEAHRSEAWELVQQGSMWHSEPVLNEAFGLWGQAFSGFVDAKDCFNVMYPSRTRENRGTINLARRPWDQPYTEKGFTVSSHGGPTLVRTTMGGIPEKIDLTLRKKGGIRLLWNMQGPLGSDAPTSDARPHSLMLRQYSYLELGDDNWRLGICGADGKEEEAAAGDLDPNPENISLNLQWHEDKLSLDIHRKTVWQGNFTPGSGAFGLFLPPFSHAQIFQFDLSRIPADTPAFLLYTEGLLGGAQGFVAWDKISSGHFKYGEGAISKANVVPPMAKWNFEGSSCTLWAPKGPRYGKGRIKIDGRAYGETDYFSESEIHSQRLFSASDLAPGRHTLVVEPVDSSVTPIDCLEVCTYR